MQFYGLDMHTCCGFWVTLCALENSAMIYLDLDVILMLS